MSGWVELAIGVALSILTALIGFVIRAFYRLSAKISSGNKDIYARIDQVKDDYVRRDDFQLHMERQERQGEKIEASVQKLDEKIDRLLARG